MAYQNIFFPTVLLFHDWNIAPTMPTTIVGNYSSEYRINRYSSEKNTFTYPAHNMAWSDWTTIYSFLQSVGWQRDTFKYTRPDNASTVVVRLGKDVTAKAVAWAADNATPLIAAVSDIVLVEVFNETGAPSFTP